MNLKIVNLGNLESVATAEAASACLIASDQLIVLSGGECTHYNQVAVCNHPVELYKTSIGGDSKGAYQLFCNIEISDLVNQEPYTPEKKVAADPTWLWQILLTGIFVYSIQSLY